MSEGIQDKATNKDAHEQTPFSLSQVKFISGLIYYQTKAGQSLYGYDTEKLNKD